MKKRVIQISMLAILLIAMIASAAVLIEHHNTSSLTSPPKMQKSTPINPTNQSTLDNKKTSIQSVTPPPKSKQGSQIDISNQPTLGDPKAPIHIVVFEDLKCMNCKQFNVDLLPKIKKQYIDTGKASYTVINLAFINGSMNAAVTARCLYDQKPEYFFHFVDYLYKHQGLEYENWTTVPKMLAIANNLPNVDTIALGVCVSTFQNKSIIQKNLELASKLMHGTVMTPSLYINGVLVRPLTEENFNLIYNSITKNREL